MTGLSALITTLAFFSRLPVPGQQAHMALPAAVHMAPIAGAIIAAPAAVVLVVSSAAGASPLLSGALAVVTLLIITGALHEDGLGDCCDGFWGGGTAERRLEIMRDSRIGAYGVLALVGAVLVKAAVLQTAIGFGVWTAALSLVAAAAAARTVALYPWVGLPPARADGLAVSVGRPTVASFRTAMILGLLVTGLAVAWWAPLGFLVAGVAAAAAARFTANLAEAKIGGHTGDVIGATIVVADLAYLIALTLWTV